MGIFNDPFGRRRREERMYENQMEERRLNNEFRREVDKKMREQQENINKLNNIVIKYEQELRELKNQNRSLRREKTYEAELQKRKNIEEMEIIQRKREQSLKEKSQLENEQNLSEKEYKSALKTIERIKEAINSNIKENNLVQLEKYEKTLRENILIFKKRFTENEYDRAALKKLNMAAEILFKIGEYYFNLKKYEKALEYFLECCEFKYKEKNKVINLIVKSSYNCGKYDIIEKFIENYNEDNEKKLEEYILKLEIYIKLEKKEEIKKIFLESKEYFYQFSEKIDKYYWKEFVTLAEKYIIENEVKEEFDTLFFYLLYIKQFGKIEELLKKIDFFHEKEFFEGLILLKNGKKAEAKKNFKKYLDKIYGMIYYIESSQDSIDSEVIKVIDKFLNVKDIVEKKYIINNFKLLEKKYIFLSYKLNYLLNTKEKDFKNVLENINFVLENDIRSKEYKGTTILWVSILNTIEYLKKIDSPLVKDYENIIYFYLTSDEIKELKAGIEETFDVDIDEEYTILDKKNTQSMYNEIQCKSNETGKKKVFIELFETMNKKNILEKKIGLKKDKDFGDNSNVYLKIDNFSINDNKIQIITEDYDKLYEDEKEKFSVLTLEERFEKAFKLIDAFKFLEENGITINKLNPDNLVVVDGNYKFRFLNYLKTTESGSLSSTKSQIAKKSNKYKSPEDEKSSITEKSNIYILGLLLYDLFYAEDIMMGIVDEKLSLEEKMLVKEAFHKSLSIDKNLVLNNNEKRFYLENRDNNTVKLKKVLEMYFVPKEITNLLNNILDSQKVNRPSLEEIEDELRNIMDNVENFNDYIPDNIEKNRMEEFLASLKNKKVKIYIRDKQLKEKLKSIKSKYDENLPALIVLKTKEGEKYEISDLGDKYTIILEKRNISLDEILKKLEKTLFDKEEIKKISEKLSIEKDNLEIFLYTINDKLNSYNQGEIFEVRDDREIFENVNLFTESEINEILNNKKIDIILNKLDKIL